MIPLMLMYYLLLNVLVTIQSYECMRNLQPDMNNNIYKESSFRLYSRKEQMEKLLHYSTLMPAWIGGNVWNLYVLMMHQFNILLTTCKGLAL